MKIIINDFGPIKSSVFNLEHDLNVIFGKNNIGKSYSITVVYLILKNLIGSNYTDRISTAIDYFMYTRFRDSDNYPQEFVEFRNLVLQEEKLISKKLFTDGGESDITVKVENLLKKLINFTFIPSLETSFANSFSSLKNLNNKYSKRPFKLTIELDAISFTLVATENYKLTVSQVKIKKYILVRAIKTNRKIHEDNHKIVVYFNENIRQSNKNPEMTILNQITPRIYFAYKNEINESIKNMYFLPASRSGLYQALSTFSAVIAELSKSRNFLSHKIELPSISEPVSDYFLNLSDLSKQNEVTEYSQIAKIIEDEILDGKITFNKDNQKIVFYSNKSEFELDLSVSSSMVSEIAPIVAYLKFIISDESNRPYFFQRKTPSKGYNLIFIEEPEAHLHPEIQIKLMEYFAKLTKCKTKVIMTTHSNYMFNKLANLIISKQVNYKNVGSFLMNMGPEGSELDEISMKANSEGIVDNNFINASEFLYNERLDAYDKGN